MTLVRRKIEVSISLGTGQFGDNAGDTVTLADYRMQAAIQAYGGDTQGALQLRIYGLKLDKITQLTNIGPIANQIRGKNSIQVSAGDEGSALSTVFIGTIDQAWGDFQTMPDVAMNVVAYSAMWAAVKPVAALSYKGAVTINTIMATLAREMGVGFVSTVDSVILTNPYLPGTALDQVRAAAKAAGVNYKIELGTLYVWPRNGTIQQGTLPFISPETGMVGYPAFSSSGVAIKSVFLPTVRQGGQVQLESSAIPAANSNWIVQSVTHTLESEYPSGAWFTNLVCTRPISNVQ